MSSMSNAAMLTSPLVGRESILRPRQAAKAPAVAAAAMLPFVEVALEPFEHVEYLREAALRRGFGRLRGTVAAAAQEQHHRVLAGLRFQFAHETRVARQARAGRPRHMQRLRHVADEFPFFGGAHVHQQRVAGREQCPCSLRCDAARVGRAGRRGRRTGVFERLLRSGSFFQCNRHDTSSFSQIRMIKKHRECGRCSLRAVYSRQRHYASAAGQAEPIKIHFLISGARNAIADARYRRGFACGRDMRDDMRNDDRSMSRVEGL
ncbi:hypothetical protein EMIT0111MI5_11331 [Burkholderia sp. IT-111MI5]